MSDQRDGGAYIADVDPRISREDLSAFLRITLLARGPLTLREIAAVYFGQGENGMQSTRRLVKFASQRRMIASDGKRWRAT